MTEVDKLKKMLISDNNDLQETALFILLHEGKKANYINELKKCAKSTKDTVRIPAFLNIAKMNNKSLIPVLEEGLQDKVKQIQMESAIALAKYRNDKAIPILRDMIDTDIRNHSLHKRAIEALGKYKDDNLIEIFEKMLNHRRIVSRIKSIEALKKLGTDRAYKILEKAKEKETESSVKTKIENTIFSFKKEFQKK